MADVMDKRTYIKVGDIEIVVSDEKMSCIQRNKHTLNLFKDVCKEVEKRKERIL